MIDVGALVILVLRGKLDYVLIGNRALISDNSVSKKRKRNN